MPPLQPGLSDGPRLELKLQGHGGGVASDRGEDGAGGQEWVQAPPLAHLELQGGGGRGAKLDVQIGPKNLIKFLVVMLKIYC